MNYSAYFSPTGGTKKVVCHIGKSFSALKEIDLSRDFADIIMKKDDFCVVGAPSFGGRVPALATERMKKLHGDKTPVLIVVTYGNRVYEDTMREMKDVLEGQGFICVGAIAAVTQHSIMPQFGAGRPSADDFKEIDSHIAVIKDRLKSKIKSVDVPGNFPYKETHSSPTVLDVSENCIGCGICADNCPAKAIPADKPDATDYERCISCMRCVSICPQKARSVEKVKLASLVERLTPACSGCKQNEFY